MDNFVRKKIEQLQADPKGEGQDARSTAHYSCYRDRRIIQIGAQGLAPHWL